MHESTAGPSASTTRFVQLNKRMTGSQSWWGGRFSYTWSQTKDNQYGESSVYQTRTATPQNNYDLASEYGVSNFDSPHRIILAPQFQIPGPKSGRAAWTGFLGGWTATADIGNGQWITAERGLERRHVGRQPRPVRRPSATEPDRGSQHVRQRRRARLDRHEPRREVFHLDRVRQPGFGQYGNAPRTIGDARYQFRKNIDLQFTKGVSFTASQTGEIRFEILNLTNTAKFNGIDSNSVNTGSFGRISSQAGFMRIWQLTFRYRF